MEPQIGMTEKNRTQSISMLEIILADEMALYVKTRKFHWNVGGDSFMELHELFQDQYSEIEETIDAVAERIGKLGAHTIGTMKEFSGLTRIKESTAYPAKKDMLDELLNDHESLIRHFRTDIQLCNANFNDAGTTDFLTGVMEQHETTAWILRRYLQ